MKQTKVQAAAGIGTAGGEITLYEAGCPAWVMPPKMRQVTSKGLTDTVLETAIQVPDVADIRPGDVSEVFFGRGPQIFTIAEVQRFADGIEAVPTLRLISREG